MARRVAAGPDVFCYRRHLDEERLPVLIKPSRPTAVPDTALVVRRG